MMDEEVDWSEGYLEGYDYASPTRAASTAAVEPLEPLVDPTRAQSPVERDGCKQLHEHVDESHEQWSIPLGQPLTRSTAGASSSSRPEIPRSQRARIGIHFNRREPTKKDYSDYFLYQANQKTYEAVFLKTFISHALHHSHLDSVLPHDDKDHANLKQYLRTVANNVNQIVAKMIWNTHSRTVNLLANDGKDNAQFWDLRQFDQKVFRDFSPDNAYPVVHQMQESWHRAWESPPMVRYTRKDYPIGKHCSPVEEIDEISATLFKDRSVELSTGRAVKPPTKKSKGRRPLDAASRRETEVTTRRDWLHDITHYPQVALVSKNSIAESVGPNDQAATLQQDPAIADTTNPEDRTCSPPRRSNDHLAISRIYEEPNQSDDLLIQDVSPPSAWCTRLIDDHKRRLAEKWPSQQRAQSPQRDIESVVKNAVARGILKPPNSGLLPEVVAEHSPVPFGWRTRLIDDHKRRLARKWPRPHQHLDEPALDLRTVIEQAISRGILKHPTAEMWRRIDIAADNERQKGARVARRKGKLTEVDCQKQLGSGSLAKQSVNPKKRKVPTKSTTGPVVESVESPAKKRRIATKSTGLTTDPGQPHPLPPHPSGSNTLEPHQLLPPKAYFQRQSEDEKPVWRCGIKHAMGYYYNAGDRRNCVGCFTHVTKNPKLKWMDFYLPPRSFFHQPAPGVVWNPSKVYAKERRSTSLSHNSIAKEAFWDAINTGASADIARKKAVEAVEERLRPKTPPREPTPTPELEPEPIDLGPHPSGSKTMEHGQDIPECAYWGKKDRHEELAWRCDVNHALGRYYLSGNRRCCPGCGSSKSGTGRHPGMDFYLPDGAVVRQEAPDLVKWRPRKPYKTTPNERARKDRQKQIVTHNQICSQNYWAAVRAGKVHDEALASALADADAELDARNEAIRVKQEELEAELEASQKAAPASNDGDEDSSGSEGDHIDASATDCVLVSVVPRKRGSAELNEGDIEEVEEYESGRETSQAAAESTHVTSSDESTSSSDSE